MNKRLFHKGKRYRVEKKDCGYNNVEGECARILRNQNGARFVELKNGTRTWWIPEMYWDHIKEVEVAKMGNLDIIKEKIKKYFINLIEKEQYSVEITEANAEVQKIIKELEETDGWIPVDEAVPTDGRYVLMSFENFSIPVIGRYEEDEEGGAWFVGDDDVTCSSEMLFVNAWMELPKPYREKV